MEHETLPLEMMRLMDNETLPLEMMRLMDNENKQILPHQEVTRIINLESNQKNKDWYDTSCRCQKGNN